MENFHYCSTEIEQGNKCLKQCNHCATHFHKLECDRREEDLLEWVESRKGLSTPMYSEDGFEGEVEK